MRIGENFNYWKKHCGNEHKRNNKVDKKHNLQTNTDTIYKKKKIKKLQSFDYYPNKVIRYHLKKCKTW